MIQVTDIVLSRILGSTLIKQYQHLIFNFVAIGTFTGNIILMENMTEKVAIIHFMDEMLINTVRQGFKPFAVITP